jgi:hypothetical protein
LVQLLEPRTLFSTIYVDANAAGPTADGLAWSTAYSTLQQALGTAVSGDQIDVAGGTYKPTTTTDTSISFNLPSGVAVYGGYAGSASTDPDTRNISLYPAILSGDIGQAGLPGDNSQVVITITNSSTLDGVTITGSQGAAAMQILAGSPTISDCTFRSNRGTYFGGAIHASSSSPTILDCAFFANSSVNGSGIYNDHGTVSAINDLFIGNTGVGTYYAAAGIYTNGGKSVITNCTFTGNIGAAVAQDSSQIILSNSICWGDQTRAQDEVYDDSLPGTIASFDDIAGGFVGTGNLNVDPMFITNPNSGSDGIWGTADDRYGNLQLRPFSPAIDVGNNNSVPAGVTTDITGSSRFQQGPAAGQTGSGPGGVDLGAFEAAPILAASAGGSYFVPAGRSITLHALGTSPAAGGLQYAWNLGLGQGFGDAKGPNPAFSAVNLSAGSVVSIAVKVTDTAQASVVASTTITVVPPVLYVDSKASGNGSGLDWNDALTTLNAALNQARPNEIIEVAGGSYEPSAAGDPKATFQLQNGVEIDGGYAGSADPSSPNSRDITSFPTILTGSLGLQNQSAAVVTGTGTDASAVLSGCTISGGSTGLLDSLGNPTISNCTFTAATKSGVYNYLSSSVFANCSFTSNFGSAVYDDAASPKFLKCAFTSNQSNDSSGAIDNQRGSSLTISNCTFTGNTAAASGGLVASGSGGAILNDASSLAATNCIFTQNNALGGGAVSIINSTSVTLTGCSFIRNSAGSGGAVADSSSSTQFINCVFDGNAASDGGAFYNADNSTATALGCLFVGNHANTDGGAIYNIFSASLSLGNCTLAANSTNSSGDGGAYYDYDTAAQLTNCILWRNSNYSGHQLHASYCDIDQLVYGNYAFSNINADPLFVRTPGPGSDGLWGTADDDYGDLHLQTGSPCINAGSNTAVPASLTTDLSGQPRISGVIVDIGAYEATSNLGLIQGTVFHDYSGDRKYYGVDGLAGARVYLDLNHDANPDPGDPSIVTGTYGGFAFFEAPGTYVIREVPPAGYSFESPATGSVSSTVVVNRSTANVLFANVPTVEITVNSPPNQTATAGKAGAFLLGSFTETNATSSYTVDVNWGDGSADTIFSQWAVGTINSQSHTFGSAGTGVVSVTVTDALNHQSNTAKFNVSISAPVAPATKLMIASQPTTGTAGAPLSPVIKVNVLNSLGKLATGDSSNITLAILTGPKGGTLTGTVSAKVVNGVATFSGLSLKIAGAYTLMASDGSLTSATSSKITIAPAAANKLVITQQPTTGKHGVSLSPAIIVDVEDAFGNVVTTDSSTVKLTVASGPSGGTVSGTVSVKAVKGIAVFTKLTLTKAGTYVLAASDGKLKTITSKAILIK